MIKRYCDICGAETKDRNRKALIYKRIVFLLTPDSFYKQDPSIDNGVPDICQSCIIEAARSVGPKRCESCKWEMYGDCTNPSVMFPYRYASVLLSVARQEKSPCGVAGKLWEAK